MIKKYKLGLESDILYHDYLPLFISFLCDFDLYPSNKIKLLSFLCLLKRTFALYFQRDISITPSWCPRLCVLCSRKEMGRKGRQWEKKRLKSGRGVQILISRQGENKQWRTHEYPLFPSPSPVHCNMLFPPRILIHFLCLLACLPEMAKYP